MPPAVPPLLRGPCGPPRSGRTRPPGGLALERAVRCSLPSSPARRWRIASASSLRDLSLGSLGPQVPPRADAVDALQPNPAEVLGYARVDRELAGLGLQPERDPVPQERRPRGPGLGARSGRVPDGERRLILRVPGEHLGEAELAVRRCG